MNYWGEKASKKGSLLNTCGIKKKPTNQQKRIFWKDKNKSKNTNKQKRVNRIVFRMFRLPIKKHLKKKVKSANTTFLRIEVKWINKLDSSRLFYRERINNFGEIVRIRLMLIGFTTSAGPGKKVLKFNYSCLALTLDFQLATITIEIFSYTQQSFSQKRKRLET